jgi:hypothetical protein
MYKIPCLFNNPEKNTHEHNELGLDVSDSDLIQRTCYFYRIDSLCPRLRGLKIAGSVIYSGGVCYHSLLSMDEIHKIIMRAELIKN